jgi:hypothetical protein
MGGSPLQVSAWAPCEEFVISYLKYNVGERDIENFKVLKTEEVDINQFLEKKADQSPLAPPKESPQ